MTKQNQKTDKEKLLKQLHYIKLATFVVTVVLGLLNFLLSSSILPWPNYYNPFWGNILVNFFYTVIIFVGGMFLVYKKKISLFTLQNNILILGIFVTLSWVPHYENVNNIQPDLNGELKWYWYRYDTITVAVIYGLIYLASLAALTPNNIHRIKRLIFKDNQLSKEENKSPNNSK
ncbi:hypothetical protein ACJA23_02110 [Mycoplasma corogypsi]|uniref:hypothetical protein n=1 Tax=Mycoplasma corogypsi TaxID=2106 RepID=UPI003873099A